MILFENFNRLNSLIPAVFESIEFWVPIKIDQSKAEVTPDELTNSISFKIPYITNDGLYKGVFSCRVRK